jgi:hypothetical protein
MAVTNLFMAEVLFGKWVARRRQRVVDDRTVYNEAIVKSLSMGGVKAAQTSESDRFAASKTRKRAY